jgi:holdfast attachment protein HfaA
MRTSLRALAVSTLLGAIAPAAAAWANPVTITSQAAAQSEGYANSAVFNSGFGMSPGQENAPITGSNRDANGNLVIVNGVMNGAGSVSQQDGVQQSSTGGGSGAGGATATAVGNSLNVTVTGTWNTVIVDSKQTNNGNQKADASLNGSLNF